MGTRRHVSAGRRRDGRLVYDSYARLSRNPSGELEKIEDQHADNVAVIEDLGGVLGEQLTDNSLSAWKHGVHRKDWERLLSRVESGASDGCVVWNTDRLLRQPRDLEKLIDLGDSGYRVASAHGEKNLADADDRYALRIDAASAAKSSDLAQRRIKFRFANQRRRGIAHTHGRCFGFPGRDRTAPAPTGEDEQPPQVSDGLVRRERAALLDGTRAVLAGDSQTTVADAWNAAGLATVTGEAWTPLAVRAVLLRPRNAGLIEHEGEVVGRMPGEPIVPEPEFARLRALYEGRRRGRRPGETYVGSGVLRCGQCGKPLGGRPHTGTYPDGAKRRQYSCVKARGGCGGVAADMRAVDTELRALVIARQSDPAHAAAITSLRREVDTRLSDVERELAECEQLQQALADRLGRREVSLEAFDKANEPLAADVARLAAERDQLRGSAPAGSGQVLSADEAAAQWDAATVGERRTMLADALGRYRLVLDRAARKGGTGGFDPDRLRLLDPDPADASH